MRTRFVFVCPLLVLSTAVLAQNSSGIPSSAQGAQAAAPSTRSYSVDGLALGSRVRFDSQAYREYQCGLSEKFPGFTWCHKEKIERTSQGEVLHANSLLHSADGTAWYVNGYSEPVFFMAGEGQKEIDRLSARFGSKPREIRMPRHQGQRQDATIFVWGDIKLEPLDASDVATVAKGGTVAGLLVGFLGDVQRSAKAGVPVYRLAGGAGFLWAATYDGAGRGVVRYLAVDDSRIEPPPTTATSSPTQPTPSTHQSTPAAPPAGNAEIDELKSKLASTEAELQSVQAQLGKANTELQDARSAEELSETKLASSEAARKSAEQQLQQKSGELASVQRQLRAQGNRSPSWQTVILAMLSIAILLLAVAVLYLFVRTRGAHVKPLAGPANPTSDQAIPPPDPARSEIAATVQEEAGSNAPSATTAHAVDGDGKAAPEVVAEHAKPDEEPHPKSADESVPPAANVAMVSNEIPEDGPATSTPPLHDSAPSEGLVPEAQEAQSPTKSETVEGS